MIYKLLLTLLSICVVAYMCSDDLNGVVGTLRENGWKVYLNANNCGFCVQQLQYLGSSASGIVVHCDDETNSEACRRLTALPTWKNESTGVLTTGAKLSTASLRSLLESSHSVGRTS